MVQYTCARCVWLEPDRWCSQAGRPSTKCGAVHSRDESLNVGEAHGAPQRGGRLSGAFEDNLFSVGEEAERGARVRVRVIELNDKILLYWLFVFYPTPDAGYLLTKADIEGC